VSFDSGWPPLGAASGDALAAPYAALANGNSPGQRADGEGAHRRVRGGIDHQTLLERPLAT